ncbi:MAG: ABC transporter substrate-binding protein [Gammaproteobacteria bacterium]|nr:ABC transporter substrate-binding protein [Gammaproteobacteria bacterium]
MERLIFALAAVVMMITACNQVPEENSEELRVGIEDHPKTLDPRYATDAYGMRILHHLLFSTLVTHTYDLQIAPGLAERWGTPDNTTYIFHLRRNISFHDGKPLSSEDVKFTFEHLMDPAVKSPFGANYRNIIARMETMDPHTVKFVLKRPLASFLTSIIMPILPKHLLAEDGDFTDQLTGSGPFKYVAQSPNEIVLAPYEPSGTPKPGRLVFKVVKDDNTRFLKMRKGELDLLINAIPAKKVDEFRKPPLNERYDLIEEPGITYNYLAFNLNDPKLQDIRIRQAIAHGIDVEEIITYRLYGHAVRATGLLSPINWFYEKDVAAWPHDLKKAAALLDAAGLSNTDDDGMRLSLELKTGNNPQTVGIARILQAQLAKIGIRLEIKSYEWGTFYGDIKSGNFQLTSMRWIGVTEPDFYYDIFHSSQMPPAGRNRGRYTDAQVDEWVETARHTLDPAKRKAIYANVQKKLAEDLPYISLWHLNNVSIVHKRINGYRLHPMGNFTSFKNFFKDKNK